MIFPRISFFFFTLLCCTILYWFCHTLTWSFQCLSQLGSCKQFTGAVVKIQTDRSGKLESYQRGLSRGILFTPRRLINWSSKLILFRGRWWGTAPVNVRSVSEKHNAVRQADWFGGRCSRKFSKAPLRPDLPLPVRPLNLMTFAMGGTPCAGSWHFSAQFSSQFNSHIYTRPLGKP